MISLFFSDVETSSWDHEKVHQIPNEVHGYIFKVGYGTYPSLVATSHMETKTVRRVDTGNQVSSFCA